MQYDFFWVLPRRLSSKIRRFGTLYRFHLHLPRKMEPIEGSKTSAFKPQTPGKYPKETYYINKKVTSSWFFLSTLYVFLILGSFILYRRNLSLLLLSESATNVYAFSITASCQNNWALHRAIRKRHSLSRRQSNGNK